MRLPIPIENSYDSTRVGTDEQRTVNMYRHSQRGWRQFPGLVEAADIAGEISEPETLDTLDMSASSNNVNSAWFKPSGAEMYLVTATNNGGAGTNTIDQWTLSSPNDISTGTYTGQITLTGIERVSILGIKSDGTDILFIGKASGNWYVYRWTMSTPWDITTATQTSLSSSVSTVSFGVFGCMNSTGTVAYLVEGAPINGLMSQTMTAYTMTAYDPTTLTATSDTLDVKVRREIDQTSIVTNADVSTIYILTSKDFDTPAIKVYIYNLSTPGTLASSVGEAIWVPSAGNLPVSFDSGTSCAALYNSDSKMAVCSYFASQSDMAQWDVATSVDTGRGAINMGGIFYAVMGPALFSLNTDNETTRIGTIAGTERVVMETDGVQLVITTGTDGGTIYVYTVAGGLVTVTDVDVEDTAKSSAYLDLAFYFDQDLGNFIASANNDATSFSTDDKIEAESFADDILRMFAHNQLLYAFGETSTEVWYTSGVGRPPVDRQQVVERGIIGTHAVASIDDTIFFVDQYGRPNKLGGLQYQPIYTPAIAEQWSTYTTLSDCIVTTYSLNKQTFVDFIFPTEDESWTYNMDAGMWCEREDTAGTRFRAIEYTNVYDSLRILDRATSKVYTFSETAYLDGADAITRTKDTGLISSDIYGDANVLGNDMICNSLKITTESTGAATLTITLSKDGAAFGQSRTMTLTAGRQTRELNAWGKFREGIFRITTTSEAGVDIVDLSADLEVLDVS